jgi:hydroxymethylpyrimidine/phosphomethylpyrimidine kinase
MKTALTIGGSDPTGGAGIQTDLKTFQSLGVHGLSIPSVLTAQNTSEVSAIQEVPPDFFSKQIDTLFRDIRPDALKTGVLVSEEIMGRTSESIKKYSIKNLVVDPVMLSSSGFQLTWKGALDFMVRHLFPLAKAITPNTSEASLITGINIREVEDMKIAASGLRDIGPENVIITGGHLEEKAIDIFFDGMEFILLQREKIAGEYHGTGCVFSSAMTAGLALGYSAREAAVNANEFVWKAIRNAFSIGKGMKILKI